MPSERVGVQRDGLDELGVDALLLALQVAGPVRSPLAQLGVEVVAEEVQDHGEGILRPLEDPERERDLELGCVRGVGGQRRREGVDGLEGVHRSQGGGPARVVHALRDAVGEQLEGGGALGAFEGRERVEVVRLEAVAVGDGPGDAVDELAICGGRHRGSGRDVRRARRAVRLATFGCTILLVPAQSHAHRLALDGVQRL